MKQGWEANQDRLDEPGSFGTPPTLLTHYYCNRFVSHSTHLLRTAARPCSCGIPSWLGWTCWLWSDGYCCRPLQRGWEYWLKRGPYGSVPCGSCDCDWSGSACPSWTEHCCCRWRWCRCWCCCWSGCPPAGPWQRRAPAPPQPTPPPPTPSAEKGRCRGR